MINPFKLISSEIKYENPWISVREDKVIRPDGQDGIFGVVTTLPGSTVLPIDNEGNIYLKKEYRYGANTETIEVPAGKIDSSETPEQAALRELNEETGLIATEIIPLGHIDPLTTIISTCEHLFLARNLSQGTPHPDPGEIIEVIKVPFETAVKWIMENKITDACSIAAILKAKEYLSRN